MFTSSQLLSSNGWMYQRVGVRSFLLSDVRPSDSMNNVPQKKGQLKNHLLLKHHLQCSHVLTTTKIPSIPYKVGSESNYCTCSQQS